MDQILQAASSEDTIYLSSYKFLLGKQVHRILRMPLPEKYKQLTSSSARMEW